MAYRPKTPRARVNGEPDRRFKTVIESPLTSEIRRLEAKIDALTMILRETEIDYENAVLANYRLVIWIKMQGMSVPSTDKLRRLVNTDHLKQNAKERAEMRSVRTRRSKTDRSN